MRVDVGLRCGGAAKPSARYGEPGGGALSSRDPLQPALFTAPAHLEEAFGEISHSGLEFRLSNALLHAECQSRFAGALRNLALRGLRRVGGAVTGNRGRPSWAAGGGTLQGLLSLGDVSHHRGNAACWEARRLGGLAFKQGEGTEAKGGHSGRRCSSR